MPNTVIRGFGAKVTIAGSVVAAVTEVDFPSLSMGFVDVTHHNQADPWREFSPDLAELGEGGFKIQGAQSQLLTLENYVSPSSNAVTFVFETSGSSIKRTFLGWIMSVDIDPIAVDGIVTAEIRVRPTGKITSTT